MPYITSVERIGYQRGVEETQSQVRQGLLEGIELGLKLKFGTTGLNLLPEIAQIEDVEVLRTILKGLENASNLEQVRQLYRNSSVS